MKTAWFNRNVSVRYWGDVYLIQWHAPMEKLKQIRITSDNILNYKYTYALPLNALKEYAAEISSHNVEKRLLTIHVLSDEYERKQIRSCNLLLTEETNQIFKTLLSEQVFHEKYGTAYRYYLSVHFQGYNGKPSDKDRHTAQGLLKYTLPHTDMNGKETVMRLKKTFLWTVGEARHFYASVAYWNEEQT